MSQLSQAELFARWFRGRWPAIPRNSGFARLTLLIPGELIAVGVVDALRPS